MPTATLVTVAANLPIEPGGRRPLAVYVYDTNGAIIASKVVTAASSDVNVATIGASVTTDSNGLALFTTANCATALAAAAVNATATLTFTADAATGLCVVQVVASILRAQVASYPQTLFAGSTLMDGFLDITPSDTAIVPVDQSGQRGIFCEVAGNVRALTPSGLVTFALGAGFANAIPVKCLRIYATGTTATGIHMLVKN